MADPCADMASQDSVLQNRIGDALEARCKEQAQVEIREAYLCDLKLPDHAFAVELGSGTGHVTHDLLTLATANRALGIEPSPVLVGRAKKKFSSETRLSFQTADAKATSLDEATGEPVTEQLAAINASIPLGRIGTPEGFGRTVAWIASPALASSTAQISCSMAVRRQIRFNNESIPKGVLTPWVYVT